MQEAKSMPIGTVRKWSNGTFIKTKDGWVPHTGGVTTVAPTPVVAPAPAEPKKAYKAGDSARLHQSFDNASAAKVFSALLSDPSSPAAQKAAREALNKLCADFGMLDRDGGKEGQFKLKVSPKGGMPEGVGGIHHWSGEIEVRDKTIKRGAEILSGTDTSKTAQAMHTLVHEAVHGHSPIRQEQFKGRYRLLEEATTEMAARKVMRDTFGIPWERFGSHASPETGMYDAGIGAYGEFCTSLKHGVSVALTYKKFAGFKTGEDWEDFVGTAAVEMRRRPPPFDKDKGEFLNRFANSLPLSDEQFAAMGGRDKVAEEVGKAVWLSLKPAREKEKLLRLKAIALHPKIPTKDKAIAAASIPQQEAAVEKAKKAWATYVATGTFTESNEAVLFKSLVEMFDLPPPEDTAEDAGMLPRNDIELAIAYARVLAEEGKLTGDALRDLALLQDNSQEGIKKLAIAVQRYGLKVVGAAAQE